MPKPNIIMIMTDDQGYGDLSCMGATDFVTPHLDALARDGARFSCMYSGSPVCSPSRAALLTGRYPGYAGVRAILAGHRRASGLTEKTPTLASLLKPEGYQTGLVGKWHLGLAEASRPQKNGFDSFYGFMAGCIDYYSHIFYWGMSDGGTNPSHDLWDGNEEVYDNGHYFTELVTDKGVEFIRQHRDEPFMLYVGYNAPHYPMHAPKKYMDRFAHLPWDRQVMAAMLSCVDDGVGELRAELERQGLSDNTIIYFQSDNGPSRESRNWMDGRKDPYYGGTAGRFTGHKYSLFEGGIRVPGIIAWPGQIPAGQVIDEPCVAMDIAPTMLEAAGAAADVPFDGRSLMGLLKECDKGAVRQLFWEMDGQTAVREGDMKLVLNGVLEECGGVRAPVFLSNLADDPREQQNLADSDPALTERLTRAATDWRAALESHWDREFAANYRSLT